MSENLPGPKPPNYELRWVIIGVFGLAILLGLSIWRLMGAPGRIPTTPQEASIQHILASPMFKHPGVVKVGPHHYRVAVVARQFQFDPAKIVVPVNARIDFYVTSADVIHGFELQGTDVNVESFPGYVAHVFAVFRTPHKYLTVCDQYCGIGHQSPICPQPTRHKLQARCQPHPPRSLRPVKPFMPRIVQPAIRRMVLASRARFRRW
ncbi:cytochrome c oxidase subunit II [Acidiphilium sp. 34-64-41]|uniref:cytochrome c oxidase subunit II n=1 Tax=Acidiphilium sp. 34-64-41 TaxID=1970297 RepID=UPI000BD01A49|nr:cytochrome c oxidase subunit II [Acidiphilium sp. 34-64-41]OZB21715.1 MAG: hypothetical protein B7X49_17565 [Acidiphilium sp. 34-64-41]